MNQLHKDIVGWSNHMVVQVPIPCELVSLLFIPLLWYMLDSHDQFDGQNQPHNGEVDLEKIQLPRGIS